MKISIFVSDPSHPIKSYLLDWIDKHSAFHNINLIKSKRELTHGDILFLVSCTDILTKKERASYSVSLVLHASDLPQGRGWSPHIWELIDGASYITLSLLEAEDRVDTGSIWKKIRIQIPSTALWDEINHLLFNAEMELMDYAINSYGLIGPKKQSNIGATYFRMRTPKDSYIEAHKTIAEQFNLMRVCDPIRYPAFFEYQGQKYILKLEKFRDE